LLDGTEVPAMRMFGELGVTLGYTLVVRDLMQRATRAKIEISETRGSLATRTFWVSTAGLAEALVQLQKRCDARKDIANTAADRLR
jgi:hypothetical protein